MDQCSYKILMMLVKNVEERARRNDTIVRDYSIDTNNNQILTPFYTKINGVKIEDKDEEKYTYFYTLKDLPKSLSIKCMAMRMLKEYIFIVKIQYKYDVLYLYEEGTSDIELISPMSFLKMNISSEALSAIGDKLDIPYKYVGAVNERIQNNIELFNKMEEEYG